MEPAKITASFFARNAAFLKLLLLGFLVLIMLIPLELVHSVIAERSGLSRSVTRELGVSWGKAQTLAGPILLLPVEEPRQVTVKSLGSPDFKPVFVEETQWTRRNLYLLPEQQAVIAELASQTRKRGIYEALLYNVDSGFKGRFQLPPATELPVKEGSRLLLDQARLLVHVSDLRGSANAPQLTWGGQDLPFEVRSEKLRGGLSDKLSWIQAKLPELSPESPGTDFSFHIKLKGSSSLRFVPLGRNSDIELTGDWPHPSFTGAQLPVANDVTDAGFSARWQISHLARGLPQVMHDKDEKGGASLLLSQIHSSAVETRFLSPVDFYRKSERSVKYGLLFVFVTFGTLFIFEAVGKRRLHAVQYLMIGAAVTLFFLLQISLAELVGFAAAFSLAAAVCVALVTLYAVKITGSRTRGLLLGGLLTTVYGYLFVTLQSEDQALLMGSLLLLALLAAAMYATRNFDWYALGERLVPPTPEPSPATPGAGQDAPGNTARGPAKTETPDRNEPGVG